MKKNTEKTKVVFRIFSKKEGGEVIAIFPRDCGTYNPATCSSYMHVGQHSSCDPQLLTSLRLATRGEYAELAKELRRLGYRLDIRTRCTRGDSRRAQAKAGTTPVSQDERHIMKF